MKHFTPQSLPHVIVNVITVQDAGPVSANHLPSLQRQELGEGLRVQKSKLGVVSWDTAQIYNPRTWEAVTGGLLLV